MTPRLTRGLVIGTSVATALALSTPAMAMAKERPARTVVEHAPGWTAHATRTGAVAGNQSQEMVAVLALRNAAGAEALARAVSDPSSSQYRHFVTPASWRQQFAPTSAQVARVTSWLRSQGFSIGEIPANHRYISFSGSAAQVQRAFDTQLSHFSKHGKNVSAPSSALSVPSTLAGSIVGIGGLDTSAVVKPMHTDASPALPPPDPVFRNAPPCSEYYGQKKASSLPQVKGLNPLTYAPCGYKPAQLRGAYGTTSAVNRGYDGRGMTVAIVDAYASKWIVGDAQEYARRNDPAHPLRSSQFRQILPKNYRGQKVCGPSGWYGEETLDVEAVHAMAPGANILYVGGRSCYDVDLGAAVNKIVDNRLADVVTNSYGETEHDVLGELALIRMEHQSYIQAAAEGISMLFSSGDSGDEIAASGTRQTDMPASDSFVTAVGGTSLAVGRGDNYKFEQGWGTGKSTLTNGAWDPLPPAYLYGGGGGTSQLFQQPWYQKGVVPKSISNYFHDGAWRAVPDVAMVGDPNTGFLVGQSQTFPDGSIRYSEYRIGGTSLSSPLFAGMVAVAGQYSGGPLGFVNPIVYRMNGHNGLRDINHDKKVTDAVVRVDYVNGFDAADGTVTSLRTLNQTGSIYTRAGYDDVTGLGSPRGMAFLNAMARAR
ncbi:MAG TPA: S53 family peptidase [Segeticoccus sp.]|uniref:S53 family peptidase n=1 Tax=Segeticoccus sp. TaxID=2706531 RepID=UPI002D7F8B6A|nr:S53 family peptidase [Segeticoccus sp.]HET8598933.1 S53 family peptidase [Segeticoccus sp.]